jgi:diguanylate cyclase (GGDEF)-like protein
MMDQLTGIPNRRNFDNRLHTEWGRAIRESFPISLLMIDIDHFKNYNDTYGHQQGDKALCMIAQVLTQALKRTSDFAARWGGEEFAVLLPNTDSNGGLEIAEQIRISAEESEVFCDNGDMTKLTISIGVNTYMPGSSCSIDEFVLRSDKALYNAKNTGRNKVSLYE